MRRAKTLAVKGATIISPHLATALIARLEDAAALQQCSRSEVVERWLRALP